MAQVTPSRDNKSFVSHGFYHCAQSSLRCSGRRRRSCCSARSTRRRPPWRSTWTANADIILGCDWLRAHDLNNLYDSDAICLCVERGCTSDRRVRVRPDLTLDDSDSEPASPATALSPAEARALPGTVRPGEVPTLGRPSLWALRQPSCFIRGGLCRRAPRTPIPSCLHGSRTGRGPSHRGSTPSRSGRRRRCRTSTGSSTRHARRALLRQTGSRNGLYAVLHPGGVPAQDVVPGPRRPVRVPRRRFQPARYVTGADALHAFDLRSLCLVVRFDRAGQTGRARSAVGPPGSCVQFVQVRCDDILIFFKAREEHLAHVRTVLETLRHHTLYANLKASKCQFGRHFISGRSVAVDPRKVAAVSAAD